jgi:hypothetical protein
MIAIGAPIVGQADSLDRQALIANFIRQDASSTFVDGGEMYCGPVAAANALAGIAELGMPSLRPSNREPRDARIFMAELFASPEYMDTARQEGTWPGRFIDGVLKYVALNGYPSSEFDLIGFSPLPQRLESRRKESKVSRQVLSEVLNSPSTLVWLHIGWYRYLPEKQSYENTGAHYLHLVGSEGGDLIALNSTPDRRHIPFEKLTLSTLGAGTLVHEKAKIAIPSYGLLSVNTPSPLKAKRVAVIQGVLKLSLRK